MEDDFVEALIASERVAEWRETLERAAPGPGCEAQARAVLHAASTALADSDVYAEEAAIARLDDAAIAAAEHFDGECQELAAAIAARLGRHRVVLERGEASTLPLAGGVSVQIIEMGRDNGVGARLWKAAEILCDEIAHHFRDTIVGSDVLELGSGVGLCGIFAAKLGAASVTLTDFEEPLLRNLTECVRANEGIACVPYASRSSFDRRTSPPASAQGTSSSVGVAMLDWLEEEGSELPSSTAGCAFPRVDRSDRFPVVIGSDLMYEMRPSLALAGVVARHMRPGGVCLLSMKRRFEAILTSFLHAAEAGFGLRVAMKSVAGPTDHDSRADESLYGGGAHVLLLLEHANAPSQLDVKAKGYSSYSTKGGGA